MNQSILESILLSDIELLNKDMNDIQLFYERSPIPLQITRYISDIHY